MRKSLIASLFCLLLLAALASAQSGRKQKKADPLPPVQGVNQPELRTQPEPEVEVEKAEKKKEGPRRALMVMTEMPDIGISSYYPDMARRGCLDEIRDNLKGVILSEAQNQTRSDALKTAKDGDDLHVLWMQFEVDRMTQSSRGGFELRYTIFEPKTGKILGSGFGYPQQPRSRVPLPPIGGNRPEILADWAGRDVAQQVLRRLGWSQ
ncbi:MAG: hypothetical protein ACREEM_22085 [Blastocatellia bacterium]